MSLLDLGARLATQRAEFLRRHQEAVAESLKRLESLLEAVGAKIADQITNPNPFRYAGDGYWYDSTVRTTEDLELKA